ncbi:MAG: DUF1565 domain-containing protein, partial [Verrucomicrobia bacterium]|nr:DUF1565 domain-containing protein [Verrucomicrobiota bacterium]
MARRLEVGQGRTIFARVRARSPFQPVPLLATTSNSRSILRLFAALAIGLGGIAGMLRAAEYHVAIDGADTAAGTRTAPFRTIQRAADVMQPGDVCTVHAGTYREWVKPPRGGTSEATRITYRAAPDENVVLKGSERVRTWTKQGGTLWRLDLPDAFFGASNPFKRNLAGEWLHFGFEYHLGDIYLDGVGLQERLSRNEVAAAPLSWWVEPAEGRTILQANFGNADPNERVTEIAVRPCILFPELQGLGFITVKGLAFAHAASQWAYWNAPQEAALGTGYGHHWIIEHCRFFDMRCVALVCGNPAARPEDGLDVAAVGRHVVRRNSFARCGQAAIHGNRGWAGSLIEGNLIEDINQKNDFGGMETGGMKIHYAVDTTIRSNVIRRVRGRRPAVYSHPKGWGVQFVGLWVDWGAQGTRVTGNVVYDVEGWATFIQNNHGSPILIDNNILAGEVSLNSQGVIFAHNLFVRSPWLIRKGANDAPYWEPHSGRRTGVAPIPMAHVKWWNNVFVGKGADSFPQETGYTSDWNVFYGGAAKTKWSDVHSRVASLKPGVFFRDLPNGVEIAFQADAAPRLVGAPLITREFAGRFALTGQGIEDA